MGEDERGRLSPMTKEREGRRTLYLTKEGKGVGTGKGKGREECDMVYQSICSNTHTYTLTYIHKASFSDKKSTIYIYI